MELVYVGSLLVLGSYFDIRKQTLPLWLLSVYALLAVIQMLLSKTMFQYESYLGILPGLGLLFIAKATRESIGYGDGIMLIITGLFLGISQNITILFLGIFLLSLYSIGYLIFGKGKKTDCIPFVPFLTLAYVLLIIINK